MLSALGLKCKPENLFSLCLECNQPVQKKTKEALKDILLNEDKRIAVIASGDQSHALRSDSPAGFAKEGAEYDAFVQQSLTNKNVTALLQLDSEKVLKAKECSYRSLLMLLGVLEKINVRPVIHSYEAPFGVGYLAVHFEIA